MNNMLSIASELIQHKVHEHFHKREGDVNEPVGIIFYDSKPTILPCPDPADPYDVLHTIKIFNEKMPTTVSGMACEAFMQAHPDMESYEHGKMNDDNAASVIILVLQERQSGERYFAMGNLDKKDNSIVEWTETDGLQFGGRMSEMDLY